MCNRIQLPAVVAMLDVVFLNSTVGLILRMGSVAILGSSAGVRDLYLSV